jgi:transcriptional regulator NrdR family protein
MPEPAKEPATTKEEPRGVICRKCECPDLRVVHTRRAPQGKIRRERRCRCCGHTFWTSES